MKKIILSTFLFSAFSVFSQQFEVAIENQTVNLLGTELDEAVVQNTDAHVTFDVKNNTGNPMNLKINRVRLANTGARDWLCWGADPATGTCYADGPITATDDWTSAPAVIPDGTDGWLSVYYNLDANTGTATYRYIFLDAADDSKVDSIDVKWNGGSVSIKEYENKISLKAYPNPAKNILTIESSENEGVLSLYDALGQKVMSKAINGVTTLDVSSLNNGVYFYSFANGNGVATEAKRLVVRR